MYQFNEQPNWLERADQWMHNFISRYRSMELEIEEANIFLDGMGAPQDSTITRRISRHFTGASVETIVENLERVMRRGKT